MRICKDAKKLPVLTISNLKSGKVFRLPGTDMGSHMLRMKLRDNYYCYLEDGELYQLGVGCSMSAEQEVIVVEGCFVEDAK